MGVGVENLGCLTVSCMLDPIDLVLMLALTFAPCVLTFAPCLLYLAPLHPDLCTLCPDLCTLHP